MNILPYVHSRKRAYGQGLSSQSNIYEMGEIALWSGPLAIEELSSHLLLSILQKAMDPSKYKKFLKASNTLSFSATINAVRLFIHCNVRPPELRMFSKFIPRSLTFPVEVKFNALKMKWFSI